MDGALLFGMVRASLRGCTIERLSGILSSTTNFVLNEMERGVSLEDAVRTAQVEGFAEADPSHDLEGWDAAAKVTVLANTLLEAQQTPLDVEREGITGVTPARVPRVLRSVREVLLDASSCTRQMAWTVRLVAEIVASGNDADARPTPWSIPT
jgi:homoserine dehydrogenase